MSSGWTIGESELLQEIEVLAGADAEGAQVALDLEHGQVFFGADNDGAEKVRPIPNAMIAFLTD